MPPGPTREHGEYLLAMCRGCHGAALGGGPIPGAPPSFPPAADLRPAALARYREADFVRMLREGRRPDGRQLSDVMPWRNLRELSDDEIHALWLALGGPQAASQGDPSS